MDTDTAEKTWIDKLPFLLRPLVWFVLCVVYLPFGVIGLGGICLSSMIGNYLRERAFVSLLQQRGRFLSFQQLTARIRTESQEGTLIIETPFPSWAVTRAWWCPEKISEMPYSLMFENYLDPDTGSACLLRAWNGKSIKRRVQRNFKQIEVVNAMASMEWWFSRAETSGA